MLRLFKNIKPYKLAVGIILFLVLLQSISDLYLPTLMSDIVDKGIVHSDTPYIWRVGGVMLLIAFGGSLCSIWASYLAATSATAFGRDLRSRVFTRVESFSLNEFDKFGVASLITRTTNDITQVQGVLFMLLRMAVSAPMMCIGGIIMAVSKDAKLSLIIVIIMPVLIGVIAITAGRGVPLFKAIQKKVDKLNLVLREGLMGIRVIRAFNRIDHEKSRFRAVNRDLTDVSIQVNRIMGAMMPAMMLIFNLTAVAIIWFGGHRIDRGEMQVGSLMAFIQYVTQIMFSLIMLSMMFIFVPRAAASAERINEVLDTFPEILDPEKPKTTTLRRGHVEFKDVSFSYPGAEQPALCGVSFTALPGEITAIIGGTGSGKSTLVGLVARFYDIGSGSILVDGLDIREMTQRDLRSRLGFVPQQAVLFSGSVAYNIGYGKDGATLDEMQGAATTAQATEFIEEMTGGYEATIAQGGTNVSGGQKQRLSIARALIRRPEVYIFDDSFSALDFRTDARLRTALRAQLSDSTVLVVAQRVSTVMDADQVIVLDEGSVVGVGTHRNLLKSCEVYREIVASQLSEEELA